jgi:hypothetical protein
MWFPFSAEPFVFAETCLRLWEMVASQVLPETAIFNTSMCWGKTRYRIRELVPTTFHWMVICQV